MVSVEGYRKHMLENNPAAFLLRDKDVESSAWNQHFHLMVMPKALERLPVLKSNGPVYQISMGMHNACMSN